MAQRRARYFKARGAFQNAMLGYAIDVDCQGQGLMREALQAVIDHAFSPAMKLHRLGFDDEGLACEYPYIDSAWRDHRMFALRHSGFVGVPV